MKKIQLSNPSTTPQIYEIRLQPEDTTAQSYEVPAGGTFTVVGSAVLRPGETVFEEVSTPSLFTPHGSASLSPSVGDTGVWYVVGAIVSFAFIKSCGKY